MRRRRALVKTRLDQLMDESTQGDEDERKNEWMDGVMDEGRADGKEGGSGGAPALVQPG